MPGTERQLEACTQAADIHFDKRTEAIATVATKNSHQFSIWHRLDRLFLNLPVPSRKSFGEQYYLGFEESVVDAMENRKRNTDVQHRHEDPRWIPVKLGAFLFQHQNDAAWKEKIYHVYRGGLSNTPKWWDSNYFLWKSESVFLVLPINRTKQTLVPSRGHYMTSIWDCIHNPQSRRWLDFRKWIIMHNITFPRSMKRNKLSDLHYLWSTK